MAFTEAESDKLIAFLQAKWKNADCRRCGKVAWSVHGVVQVSLARTTDRGIAMGGTIIPTGLVICRECGSTEMVNLVVAGLVKVPQ